MEQQDIGLQQQEENEEQQQHEEQQGQDEQPDEAPQQQSEEAVAQVQQQHVEQDEPNEDNEQTQQQVEGDQAEQYEGVQDEYPVGPQQYAEEYQDAQPNDQPEQQTLEHTQQPMAGNQSQQWPQQTANQQYGGRQDHTGLVTQIQHHQIPLQQPSQQPLVEVDEVEFNHQTNQHNDPHHAQATKSSQVVSVQQQQRGPVRQIVRQIVRETIREPVHEIVYQPVVYEPAYQQPIRQTQPPKTAQVIRHADRSPPLTPPSMPMTTFSQQQLVTQKLRQPIQVVHKPVQNKPSIEFPRASYIRVEDEYKNGEVRQQVVVQPVRRQMNISQPVLISTVTQPVLVKSQLRQQQERQSQARQSARDSQIVAQTSLMRPSQQFQILIPSPQFVTAQSLHKMISSAYYERKQINMRYFTRYMHNRNHYNLKHSAVLDDMTEAMLSKLQATNNFLDDMASFIQHISQPYSQFQKEFIDLQTFSYLSNPANQKTKNRLAWSINTTNGMSTLLATHRNCTLRMKQQRQFLLKTVEQIKKLKETYNKKVKEFGKQSMSLKNRYCDFQQKIIRNVKNIHKKVKEEVRTTERKPSTYDLLQLQLIVLEWVQKSKQLLVDWGTGQMQWWNQMTQLDIEAVMVVRDLVLAVLQTVEALHYSRSVDNTIKYWRSADFEHDVRLNWTPQRVLSLTSLDFLKNSLEVLDNRRISTMTTDHVSDWTRIRNLDKTTGDRQVIIDSLSTKVFPSMFNTGKSWVTALLVATIDQNMLILTEFEEREEQSRSRSHYHLVKKVPNKSMYNTRLNEVTVSINQKREGIFTDSWKKEQIQFKDTDEADEFMYFTENKTDLKQQYVQ